MGQHSARLVSTGPGPASGPTPPVAGTFSLSCKERANGRKLARGLKKACFIQLTPGGRGGVSICDGAGCSTCCRVPHGGAQRIGRGLRASGAGRRSGLRDASPCAGGNGRAGSRDEEWFQAVDGLPLRPGPVRSCCLRQPWSVRGRLCFRSVESRAAGVLGRVLWLGVGLSATGRLACLSTAGSRPLVWPGRASRLSAHRPPVCLWPCPSC